MTERGRLSNTQRERLCKPINPGRVLQDRDGFSHLPAFDVVAHLTRIFGFEGWDKEILRMTLVEEVHGHPTKQDKKGWYVTYLCELRLTIRAPSGRVVKVIDEVATGTGPNRADRAEAHDMAAKNAISYAIKRCAKDLGDQFGLSLYNKGSLDLLVNGSTAYAPGVEDGDLPEPRSMGNDERQDES